MSNNQSNPGCFWVFALGILLFVGWVFVGGCPSSHPGESFEQMQKRVHFEVLKAEDEDKQARDLEQMRRWNEEQEYRAQQKRYGR